MNPTLLAFIAVMAAIAAGFSLSWMQIRSRPQPARGDDELGAARQIELLSAENAVLKGQVSRLEERIAVLERIATDPAERTAREIEDLR